MRYCGRLIRNALILGVMLLCLVAFAGGAFATGNISVSGANSTIKDISETRGVGVNPTASVYSVNGVITASNGGMVWEEYIGAGMTVAFNDTAAKDPYANDSNIANIANYTWSPGALVVDGTGLRATKNLDSGVTVSGVRTTDVSGEPVKLSGGTHQISFPGSLSITEYMLTYTANGGITADVILQYRMGDVVTVAAYSFAREGYTFTEWNTAADGTGTSRAVGERFVMPSGDVTLYAQWAAYKPGEPPFDPKPNVDPNARYSINEAGGATIEVSFTNVVGELPVKLQLRDEQGNAVLSVAGTVGADGKAKFVLTDEQLRQLPLRVYELYISSPGNADNGAIADTRIGILVL